MITLSFAFLFSFLFFILPLGVGGFFSRRDPDLLGALYRGFLFIGLISFVSFILPPLLPLLSLLVLFLFALSLRDRWWLRDPLLLHYALFFLYIFLWQTLSPFYYGAGWYGDWFEHYERVLFFLHQRPLNYSFLSLYGSLARTPLFHLVQAFFFQWTDASFYLYQALSTVLNTLFFFPFVRFLQAMKREKWTFLLMLSPFVLRMATYTFPKAFTAFFVLTALFFYFKKRPSADVGLCFGGALLAHQSALFYLAPLLLFMVFQKKIRDALTIASTALLPLSIWFAFGTLFYSFSAIFTQTPAIAYLQPSHWTSWLQIKGNNLIGAFLPAALFRIGHLVIRAPHAIANPPLILWDSWLNFAFGALPAVWTLSLTFSFLRERRGSPSLLPRFFLTLIVPFALVCDLLTAGNAGVAIGVAQNGMMPLVLLLGLAGLERLNYLSVFVRVGIALEFLLSFGLLQSLFLFPQSYPALLRYYSNNAQLFHRFQLTPLLSFAFPYRFLILSLLILWSSAHIIRAR